MPLDAALKRVDIIDDRALKYVADNSNDPVAAAAAGFINLYRNRPGELVKAFGLPDEARHAVAGRLIELGMDNIEEMYLRELENYIEENGEAPNTTQIIAAAQIARKVPDPRFKSGHRIVLAINGKGSTSAGFAQVQMTYGPNGTNMTSNSADLIDQLMGSIDEETLFITMDFPTKSELDGIQEQQAALAQMMVEPAADAGAAAQKLDEIIEQVQQLAELTDIDVASTIQLAANAVEAVTLVESGAAPDSPAVQQIVEQIAAQISDMPNIPPAILDAAQTVAVSMEASAPQAVASADMPEAAVGTPVAERNITITEASPAQADIAASAETAQNDVTATSQPEAMAGAATETIAIDTPAVQAPETAQAQTLEAVAIDTAQPGVQQTELETHAVDSLQANNPEASAQAPSAETMNAEPASIPDAIKADTPAVVDSVQQTAEASSPATLEATTAEVKPADIAQTASVEVKANETVASATVNTPAGETVSQDAIAKQSPETNQAAAAIADKAVNDMPAVKEMPAATSGATQADQGLARAEKTETKSAARSFSVMEATASSVAASGFAKAAPTALSGATVVSAAKGPVTLGTRTNSTATPVTGSNKTQPASSSSSSMPKPVPPPANTNASPKQPAQAPARPAPLPAAVVVAQVQAIARQPDLKNNETARKVLDQVAKTIESGGQLNISQQADLKKIADALPPGPQRSEIQAIAQTYSSVTVTPAVVVVQPEQRQALQNTIAKIDQALPQTPQADAVRHALQDIANTGQMSAEQAKTIKEWVQENPRYESVIPQEVSRALPESTFAPANAMQGNVVSFQKDANDGSDFEVELGCKGKLCAACGKCAIGSQPDATPSSAEIAVQTNVDKFSLKNG